jgi:hypothetical protein
MLNNGEDIVSERVRIASISKMPLSSAKMIHKPLRLVHRTGDMPPIWRDKAVEKTQYGKFRQ